MFFELYLTQFSGEVKMFSQQHLVPIVIGFAAGWIIITYAKRKLKPIAQNKVFNNLGWFLCISIILYHVNLLYSGHYNIKTDLPLFLSTFMALLIPLFTSTRKYWLFEIFVFWIIAGTTHGIIEPDIKGAFPDLEYFRYWIVHLGLYIIIFYAIIVFKMRPKFASIFKAVAGVQFYIVLMAFINYFLGSNYSYLNAKPLSASVLDHFGEWPTYLIVVELLVIPYFLFIYFLFYLSDKKKEKH